MVGNTGIEPVTPAMSMQCSTAELIAPAIRMRCNDGSALARQAVMALCRHYAVNFLHNFSEVEGL